MRPRSTLALLAALALAGCNHHGRLGAIDASRWTPRTDAQLHWELGSTPTPGPSVSSELHDGAGKVVALPGDSITWADTVVAYEPGIPAPIPEGEEPTAALGAPDYEADAWQTPRAVSLGNGGALTLGFTRGALVDGDGPDIFIYEIGPGVEAMLVDISVDGRTWLSVGEAVGGACAVDIGPYVEPGEVFRYVRLRDVAFQGAESDAWPGADIDAVGVREGAERVALPSEVLFERDSDVLGDAAPAALDKVVATIARRPGGRVTVSGHTDDRGSDEYNQRLSERRAAAVGAYLIAKGVAPERVVTRGFGETRPVGLNDAEQGRRQNRRVEILIQRP